MKGQGHKPLSAGLGWVGKELTAPVMSVRLGTALGYRPGPKVRTGAAGLQTKQTRSLLGTLDGVGQPKTVTPLLWPCSGAPGWHSQNSYFC